jgi:hypothetical protein
MVNGWHEGFNEKAALQTLEGDKASLSLAFIWAETSKGYDFWLSQYENGLDAEGKFILENMLLTYSALRGSKSND